MFGITPNAVAEFAPDYFVAVRNPKWVNADHTQIECEVNFKHVDFEEWTPFCADPADFMPYSKRIFDECVEGRWGAIAEYVPPPPPEEPVADLPQPESQGTQNF